MNTKTLLKKWANKTKNNSSKEAEDNNKPWKDQESIISFFSMKCKEHKEENEPKFKDNWTFKTE